MEAEYGELFVRQRGALTIGDVGRVCFCIWEPRSQRKATDRELYAKDTSSPSRSIPRCRPAAGACSRLSPEELATVESHSLGVIIRLVTVDMQAIPEVDEISS